MLQTLALASINSSQLPDLSSSGRFVTAIVVAESIELEGVRSSLLMGADRKDASAVGWVRALKSMFREVRNNGKAGGVSPD